ncbi:MAG TPA: acid phosphatase [Gemmataceae bacterium]|jgi:phospholipase C|nr:acid phosphatase [Gemmataceae bacterium]
MARSWRLPARKDRPRRRPAPPRLEALEDRLQPDAGALGQINHFVVIYQENWSFDALYGNFPGANGIANASPTSLAQIDRLTGKPYTQQLGQPFDLAYTGPQLTTPPQPLNNGAIDTRFPAGLNTLQPYDANNYLSPGDKTGDIVHRFYQEQSQINGGAQNGYVTWSDNPGLVMSHFDATNLPEGLLAQQYTMDDNFFHASFGGSFLNHQFLVAAAAPVYPNAPASMVATLGPDGQLALSPTTGKIVHDGNITPVGGASFADPGQTFAQNYAINTIFSKNLAPDFVGNNTAASLLPSQNDSDPSQPNYIPTIGDRLDQAGVNWKWYSGGWDNALAGSPSNPANGGKTPANDPADPLFQWHHQPLAYYNNFAPWLPNGQRNPLSAAHLQDETNFFADLSSGGLPAVSFIKPLGPDNEHPGYASLLQGQQHVADIVHAVQNSPDWAHTAIIITYDENGGRWDHVSAPDNNGIWGDGSRVPAIVISPYAKKGFVDHTQHDTLSILKTVEERFGLKPLNQFDAKASDLSADFQKTAQASIGSAYVQPDADNPGKFALIVQGTEGNDFISVTQDSGELHVQIRGRGVNYDHFFAQPISRLEVYGQGGNDVIFVAPDVTTPAFLFGGAGNSVLLAGGGPTVEVGGAGRDVLVGGRGASILIGGAGNDLLVAGAGGSILIGGTTKYDANIAALKALEAEWSRTDETYLQRVTHLNGGATGGLNGAYLLNTSTVHDDGATDVLVGGKGMDWFFARLSGKKRDFLFGVKPGEIVTDV